MEYDCIIIGSGMAGLTASLYLARANKSVMIIEDTIIGGTTATLDLIENYPGFSEISGLDLVQKTLSQVSKLGVTIDMMNITQIDFDNKCIVSSNSKIYYKTLIIASGTSRKRLNLNEEDSFKFRGLSYCAVCDGPLFKKKKIAVATNGNTGKDTIEYLSNITEDIIVVDCSDKFKSDKFKFYSNSKITKINGSSFVESIDVTFADGRIENIPCNAIFVSLGKDNDLSLFKDRIETKNGYIKSDENMHTNLDGVYVAGDVRLKSLRQIVTACADGAIAGTEAIKYLQSNN
jgi:thioredoxin reductase (NADPH)